LTIQKQDCLEGAASTPEAAPSGLDTLPGEQRNFI